MLAIIRMIVVLSSICGLSGFALSYLKISTAPRIEEQVLTYVQGPAILKVFADIDNSPIAERKTFTLDGAKVTVFPGKKDGKLVAVALEHFGKGFGGDVGVMVGYDVNRDTLTGIGITTMKETPGLGTRVADPAFTGQFTGKPADARLKSQGGDIDAVSGAPLDNDIEIVYKEHFDDMVTHYADELTEAELLVSADVYDAIGMIRFDSEDSLAARQRIYGIASADDLHAILTGYFDPNDAAYTADTALDARLQAILAACGLNPEDYDISVIRNLSGMPEPITGTNWYCTLIRKGVEVAEDETNPYDMVIVLYGDEMTVGAFVLNPEV